MSVFDHLIGQEAVQQQLALAAAGAREIVAREHDRVDGSAYSASRMSQAWLFTGPPGSGRSVAALAFAAALECSGETPGCGRCVGCLTVLAKTHPDVEVVSTEGVTITVENTRDLVAASYSAPSVGNWRIIIVEDADRMAERTTNVLLKAIEEPPPFTVWMLCTPSPEDVMQTIRSRCRIVTLAIPSVDEVAQLLVNQLGVTPEAAIEAACASQSHIGRAKALVSDPVAAQGRRATLSCAAGIRGVGDAMIGGARLIAEAERYAAEAGSQLDASEREELARSVGMEEGSRMPPALRAQFRELEERQKRRVTRLKRDNVDRAMIDILSLFRDVLTVQLGAEVGLVNRDYEKEIRALAAESTPEQSIRKMDAIAIARQRLSGNVDPLLTIEAMLVSLRPQG